MIENWNLCWQMIACACATQSMDGGEVQAPFHQVKSERCTRPSPTYSVSCHVIWGLSTSAHVGRLAHVRARPCRGVGGLLQIPPPTPSAVMPRYVTPVSHCTLQKILNKQTGRTCWPCSLPLRQLQYSIGQKKSAMERKIPRMSLNI